jgi:hypothetical protein
MTNIEFVNRPPAGWFVFDVMRENARTPNWVALMFDVDPDELRRRPEKAATAREVWVRIAGKYRSRDSGWDALEDLMATRH